MKVFKLAISIYFLCASILFSQIKGISPTNTERLFEEDLLTPFQQDKLIQKETFPAGNVVDPKHYKLGPGDIISILNLSISSAPQFVTISPENTLIIPRIGEISVSNLSLAELKDYVIKEYKERNPNAVVSVSLYVPRKIVVKFTGDVEFPGVYTLPASYRVSTALMVINQYFSQNQTNFSYIEQQKKIANERKKSKTISKSGIAELSSYARRNIYVKHQDGSVTYVDLEKASALVTAEFDPYLREGDEIYVPFEIPEYPQVSISGAVIRPASFPYKKGDRASLLIKFAQGFTADANKDGVKLILPKSGEVILKVNDNLEIIGEDVTLEPGAKIIVPRKAKEVTDETGLVSVIGNVLYPDIYPIVNNKTRLKEIIEKAGGLTEKAYLPASYIIRRERKEYFEGEEIDIKKLFQQSDLTLEDTLRFILHQENRKQIVACDFEELFKNNSEKDNVLLQDGDVIVISDKPFNVYVYGQVNNPGYVSYVEGKTVEWYIEQVGGYAKGADKSRTRLIKLKNLVWKEPSSSEIVHAGDEIYVPQHPDLPPGYEIQTYGMIASILASAATLINIIFFVLRSK